MDFYYIDNKAFVYSIPYEAAMKETEFFVTSSHAIFVGNSKMSAPGTKDFKILGYNQALAVSVGVVGVQYNYSSFYSTFFKTAEQLNLNCLSDEIDCFVLDNNGFVMLSEKFKQAGMFFGEINDDILQDMVRTGIFRRETFFDYQAICIEITDTSSSASISLMTPFVYLKNVLFWMTSRLVTFYLNLFYEPSWAFVKVRLSSFLR